MRCRQCPPAVVRRSFGAPPGTAPRSGRLDPAARRQRSARRRPNVPSSGRAPRRRATRFGSCHAPGTRHRRRTRPWTTRCSPIAHRFRQRPRSPCRTGREPVRPCPSRVRRSSDASAKSPPSSTCFGTTGPPAHPDRARRRREDAPGAARGRGRSGPTSPTASSSSTSRRCATPPGCSRPSPARSACRRRATGR